MIGEHQSGNNVAIMTGQIFSLNDCLFAYLLLTHYCLWPDALNWISAVVEFTLEVRIIEGEISNEIHIFFLLLSAIASVRIWRHNIGQ